MTDSFADRWARRFLYALIVLQAIPFFGLSTGLDWPGIRRLNFYKLIVIVLLLGLFSARLDRVLAALRSRTKLIALCAALAIWVGLFLGTIAYHPGLRSNMEIFLLYWTPSLLVFAYLLLLFPAPRRHALVVSLAGFYALVLTLGYLEWLTWKFPELDAFFLQFRETPHFRLGNFLRVGGSLGFQGLAESVLIGWPIVVGLALEAYRRRCWLTLSTSFALFPMGMLLLLRTFLRHPLLVIPLQLLTFGAFNFHLKITRKILIATMSAGLVSLLLGWGYLVASGHGGILLARYFAATGSEMSVRGSTNARTDEDEIVRFTADTASRNISLRVAAYEVSWNIIRDWPWTGVGMGPDGFAYYWKSFAPRRWPERDSPWTHAHNFYIQMFVSGGLLAGLGFLCLVLLILRKSWQVWKRSRLSGEPQLSPIEIGVLAAVVGVFVSMLFDFKYNLQWSTLILWVLLGTVILILDNPDGQDSTDVAISEKPAETAPES